MRSASCVEASLTFGRVRTAVVGSTFIHASFVHALLTVVLRR
ncbi:MAG: hypothetical protein WDA60_03830 [Acidimicrobiia bacterium]